METQFFCWLHNCTSVYYLDFILKIVIFVNIISKNLTDKQKCMCEFVFRYFPINRENENKLYCQVYLHIRGICYSDRNMNAGYTFTFMHLADAFIQSDLQYIQVMHVPWELNPQPFVLLMQCKCNAMQIKLLQARMNGDLEQCSCLTNRHRHFFFQNHHSSMERKSYIL